MRLMILATLFFFFLPVMGQDAPKPAATETSKPVVLPADVHLQIREIQLSISREDGRQAALAKAIETSKETQRKLNAELQQAVERVRLKHGCLLQEPEPGKLLCLAEPKKPDDSAKPK